MREEDFIKCFCIHKHRRLIRLEEDNDYIIESITIFDFVGFIQSEKCCERGKMFVF